MLTIKITNNHDSSSVEMIIDEDLNTKRSFEIQKILKSLGNQIVERGIKNDVKKYLKKEKK